MERNWAAAWRAAERQGGVVSRSQLAGWGIRRWQTSYRLDAGAWERVAPRVYRLAGTARTFEQRLKAIQLWSGAGAVFSHATAARLWGLSRFLASDTVHLTRSDKQRPPGDDVVLHRGRLEARDVGSTRGFRVTSVGRTILDVSATEAWSDVRAAVDEAVRRQWISLDRLAVFVERARARRGVAPLRVLLDEYAGGQGPTESELEARVLDFLERHGLPRPRRQQRVIIGGRCRRLDFSWPERRLVVEADGYAWHADVASFERDRQRRSALTARGLRVLQWTWAALEQRPEALVSEFRRLWNLA
ncbi:MAG: endonuclease domain-containing protein [Myxococcaceae bacterium]|nr:endonuclease domain-containing protein [Myxococcaceae bacterium]